MNGFGTYYFPKGKFSNGKFKGTENFSTKMD